MPSVRGSKELSFLNLMASKEPAKFGTHYYHKPLIYDQICVSPGLLDDAPQAATLTASIGELTLVPGTYFINVYAYADGMMDGIEPATTLEVEAADVYASDCTIDRSIASTYFPCAWQLSHDGYSAPCYR